MSVENGDATAAAENGENKENVEGKGGEGKVEGKKKALKKSVPGWATLSDEAKKRLIHSKVDQVC
jgi:hypothetical protein